MVGALSRQRFLMKSKCNITASLPSSSGQQSAFGATGSTWKQIFRQISPGTLVKSL